MVVMQPEEEEEAWCRMVLAGVQHVVLVAWLQDILVAGTRTTVQRLRRLQSERHWLGAYAADVVERRE